MLYEIAFFKALSLTVILEVIAAAALKIFFGRRLALSNKNAQITFPRLLTATALASVLTLPYVWFLLPAFIPSGTPYIITSELSVTIIEAIWYMFIFIPHIQNRKDLIKVSIILSITTNAFSYLIGNVLL